MRILQHLWTIFLLFVAIVFLVLLPYKGVVESSAVLWTVVVFGIVVSFVCSASELAFAIACGESVDSSVYKDNLKKSQELQALADDESRTEAERQNDEKEAYKLQLIIQIGERYASDHNPTLVVANNTAITIVAVLPAWAFRSESLPTIVGQTCAWPQALADRHLLISNAFGWLDRLGGFRCLDIRGFPLVPFPVKSLAFQTALSLTMVLIFGEIVPKQMGTAYPDTMTRILFPVYRVLGLVFSLGTGRSFGALGRIMAVLILSTPIVCKASTDFLRLCLSLAGSWIADTLERLRRNGKD